MPKDIKVQEWDDGHGLYQDRWQWIIRHGSGCLESGRTHFLRQPANVLAELGACGHPLPLEGLVQVPGGPRLA